MTPEFLAAELRRDVAWASKTLISEGYLDNLFIIHTRDAVNVFRGWRDDRERERLLALMKAWCIVNDAMAICNITEAWAKTLPPFPGETEEEWNQRAVARRASSYEDRKEIVIVSLYYRDAETGERQRPMVDMREIERRANGKPSGLIPFAAEYGAPDDVDGDIPAILMDGPPSDRLRALAEALIACSGFKPSVVRKREKMH